MSDVKTEKKSTNLYIKILGEDVSSLEKIYRRNKPRIRKKKVNKDEYLK